MLGSETDSLDNTGTIIETIDCSHITSEMLQVQLTSFIGETQQIPPMYSALKKEGKPLYQLARSGIEVERAPRNVTVYELKMIQSFLDNAPIVWPYFGLNLKCSGGFYVRSLISDLARKCTGRAHMCRLWRTEQGGFQLEDCLYEHEWKYDILCSHIIRSSNKVGLDCNTFPPAIK